MLIADTHIHIYPEYDAASLLDNAVNGLLECAQSKEPEHLALFLTERRDCNFFEDLAAGKTVPTGYRIEQTSEPEAITLVKEESGQSVILFAGRQYVTYEKIEVLSLACGQKVEEFKPAENTIDAIRAAGGVPVLSWAPGKWSGRRGQIVRGFVDNAQGETLLLGDTCMRAAGVPEPSAFENARNNDVPICAGTDPLPFAGDETIAGTYGIESDAFDINQPASSVRELLAKGSFNLCGQRSSLPLSLKRWIRNQIHKSS